MFVLSLFHDGLKVYRLSSLIRAASTILSDGLLSRSSCGWMVLVWGKILMRQLVGLALAFVCAGCAGSGANPGTSDFPVDYRTTIAAQKATLFKDPSSVRDTSIGIPRASMMGWQVCLRANAKNGFGGYTGLNTYIIQMYRNGSPPVLLPTTIYDGCGSDYYVPFAELNGDYVAPVPMPPPQPAPTQAGKPRKLRTPAT